MIIDVAAVPFNGLIYAPNAPVSITGTGTFTGAVIGQSVSISLSGDLKIVSDLNNVNQKTDKGKENRQYGLNYNLGEDGSIVYGWKPVSWSEFKRSK
ncbi:hypothetical protein KF707_15940 [Candidatus Obscuribacterales bacterium]|nr:hypothetical protein [Candidatus Obscuribacterales bacterium]